MPGFYPGVITAKHWFMKVLAHFLRRLVRTGDLSVVDVEGQVYQFGTVGTEPSIAIRLHDRSLYWKLLINPGLFLGEAWMDGTVTVKSGNLPDLLALFGINSHLEPPTRWDRLLMATAPVRQFWQQWNPAGRSKRNVAHHYDLSDTLYDLFLDRDRQYSCAYFTDPANSLETAQYDKKRHLAAKLCIQPGMRVLDIGSGWGGLALFLARECGADVTGLTLSVEQHAKATERAAASGLADKVRFHLRDYRAETSSYDRIVSVGMFEHVGVNHYGQFFAQVDRLLKPDGIALIHSIGRMDGPGTTNPWLRKYIFPGGYAPALSEVVPVVERAGLHLTDIEILRLHYAETLKAWAERFSAAREQVRELYDERFCRMWEFYLAAAEMDFRHHFTMVFQMQLAKKVDAVPLTRDYIVDWERSHEQIHANAATPPR